MQRKEEISLSSSKTTVDTTYMLTLTALFAAILAAASWISVPLPFTPIPVNLATLAVTLTGALLGWRYGSLSVIIYILLGACGVPVFAGFTGGLGHIAGPTGGYIIGYITSAFISGLIVELFYNRKSSAESESSVRSRNILAVAAASVLGTASCYTIGTIWFMILTGSSLYSSLAMCVVPFIPGDLLKTAAAVILVPALRKALTHLGLN